MKLPSLIRKPSPLPVLQPWDMAHAPEPLDEWQVHLPAEQRKALEADAFLMTDDELKRAALASSLDMIYITLKKMRYPHDDGIIELHDRLAGGHQVIYNEVYDRMCEVFRADDIASRQDVSGHEVTLQTEMVCLSLPQIEATAFDMYSGRNSCPDYVQYAIALLSGARVKYA